MAEQSDQDLFMRAVYNGNRAEWQRLLEEGRVDKGECLLSAVRGVSEAAVRDVLTQRPPLNMEDTDGQRPIHLAACHGTPSIIALLVGAGCTVNASNREGWCPLHLACQHGMSAVAEQLIACGASVNAARTWKRFTPLHVAVDSNQDYMIRVLLNHSANPNVWSSHSHGQVSPLTMAADKPERSSVLETFLEAASRCGPLEYRTAHGSYPLNRAVKKGDVRTCQLLLSYLPYFKPILEGPVEDGQEQSVLNLKCGDFRPLTEAIVGGRREIVEMLLDAGCATENFMDNDMLPLQLAISSVSRLVPSSELLLFGEGGGQATSQEEGGGRMSDDALVHLLVDRGVNLHQVSKQGDHPIHMALSARLLAVALKITQLTPDRLDVTDSKGDNPLHIACRIHSHHQSEQQLQLELVRRLLELGVSVNALTHGTLTCPLSFAIITENVELVSLLLQYGPDLTLQNIHSLTPLHFAARCQNVGILEMLLNVQPQAVVNIAGQSLLNVAVSVLNLDTARFLLDRQADPNFTNPYNGLPPLHHTIRLLAGRDRDKVVPMLALLMERGADLDQRSRHENATPLQVLLNTLVCLTPLPNGKEVANTLGLSIIKTLVEAGSKLQPWPLNFDGTLRHSPMQCLAFCGLLPCAYYLANVGWPLHMASPVPDPGPVNTDPSRSSRLGLRLQDWATLPGKTPEQDNLHAFLMLRNANPFSLMHLARDCIRHTVMARMQQAHSGGQWVDIRPVVESLPLPDLMKKFLKLHDADYSKVDNCWEKLLHLLPSQAMEEAIKDGLTS